ncbi:excinuclease ABC subunit UvrA [Chlamydia avium]|uniref:UvrABC system protein A n=1 Tax=Chlamydia avium TaxID=1457141 RepID=A0ABN0MRU1_9CHLA|nr:excinuclease ABC subunit UvrA [Chlamydia avium]EPP37384.1 excinuclease ABC subunit A [Chlamydia psittaci 10_743_SC13]EPP38230.1 excinuclease ABC subunit A [Chlamydia avium]
MKHLPVLISGITVRNLKNISIEFFHGEIILLTGVSGSGKSSLAFDTIYAAGRKNYVSTLPSFFATTVTNLPDPSVDTLVGLSPTMAVKQQPYSHHIHATVGSVTELSQHLALLFSLDGEARDPHTNKPLQLQSKEKILSIVENIPDNTQITLLAPLKDKSLASIQECIRQGYTKVRIQNVVTPIYSFLSQPLDYEASVDVVVDTLIKNETNQARLKVSVLAALNLGEGQCYLATPDHEETFSTQIYIPETQQVYTPLTPQAFSPHSIQGRCLSCQGTGILVTIHHPSLIQQNVSIRDNCCSLAGDCSTYFYNALYQSLANYLNFSLDTPWKDLPKEIQQAFLYGKGYLVLPVRLFDSTLGKKVLSHKLWKGILNDIGEKVRYSTKAKEHLPEGTSLQTCPKCKGSGIGEYACAATWKGKTFPEFQEMPINKIFFFLSTIQEESQSISEILDGLRSRLSLLIDLGLPYLTLNRTLSSLSGGEQERTILVKHLGAELSGITYILDEPSIGLHPRDTHKLIHVIQKLRNQGNTVLLVEHDEKMISFVDRIIDIGPGAGIFGGEVLFNGSPKDFLKSCQSLTAKYIRQELNIEIPKKRPPSQAYISLTHATTHNLKDITVSLPLERITAIVGVSGSGKSSLINDTLVPAVENAIQGNFSPFLKISGGKIERIVHSTRDLPGRSQRSIPLTYLKAFDDLRNLFAQQTKSKRLGLTKGHFSFNLPLGSCTECQGLGSIALSEDLVPIACNLCHGKRFQPQILEIQYQGKNIADILEMTAYEAEKFFITHPVIHEKIHALCSLGLDHLPLGRPLSSLSGGEIQRLKLAYELLSNSKKPTLYILDEPTTGLHTHDIKSLISVLLSLTHLGHTVILIEHNMHIVKIADHVIELGPEGGELGGYLLASCPPEELIALDTPTAEALRPYMKNTLHFAEHLHTLPIPSFPREVVVRDAYHNNLKHIDVSIPYNAFTVISGPSASGKHSLIFDILYAAGNITYAELFPTYIREGLIKQTPLPLVKSVRGLSPVVAIKKTGIRKNSRHSLASFLGITKNLEKLFSLLGEPHSPITGEALIKITPQTIVNNLLLNYLNSYVTIASPLSPDDDIDIAIKTKKKEGYLKLFANNTYYDLEEPLPPVLEDPAIVIQHTKITKSHESSLLSSVTLALSLSSTVYLHIHSLQKIETLSYTLGWQDSNGIHYPNITHKHLSREHKEGQCQQCLGSGTVEKLSFLENKEKILKYTPIDLFCLFFPESSPEPVLHLLKTIGISKNKKIQDLSPSEERKLFSNENHDINLEKIFIDTLYLYPSCSLIHPLISSKTCPSCQGWGIHTYAQKVLINTISLITIYQEDTQFLRKFLDTIKDPLAQPLLQKLYNCLSYIDKVGLSYITLSQEQHTLSDGEYYRLHLAKKISTNLTGIVYLLENPLSGLHPHDFSLLAHLLKGLVSNHNTVIASDCSTEATLHADHTITLGPGSGPKGGYLITHQPPTPIEYLPSSPSSTPVTFPIDLSVYNIKNLHVEAPMNSIVAIAGVSGSGKTSLLVEGFYKQAQQLIATGNSPYFSHVSLLDSHPLSALQRSDISTYFHVAPHLRNFYSSLTQAQALNLSPSMFSTNTKQGQCSDCLGLGYHLIDRAFYALEKRICHTCSGFRIQPLTQEVVYEGIHFGKLLQLPITEVVKMFSFLKNIQTPLRALIEAGLGYLSLGHNFASLSLSEKISIKIVKTLYLPPKKRTLFLLDEITSSLDRDKKNKLYKVLRDLTSQGHSIIYVDHDIELLKHADHIIELGPGSGKYGGNVLFSGDPKNITTATTSLLKQYLA